MRATSSTLSVSEPQRKTKRMNRALRLFSVHLHVVYTTRFFVLRFRFIELVRLASVKAIVNIQSQLPAFNHIIVISIISS